MEHLGFQHLGAYGKRFGRVPHGVLLGRYYISSSFFVDRSRRNFTFLKDPNSCSFSMMYCCSGTNHYVQQQISCMFMGSCRWVIIQVTVLQIFPSSYLQIHEIPHSWTQKATLWWLRPCWEWGCVVPGLSQDVCLMLRTRPCEVAHPSCSPCGHLSPHHHNTHGRMDTLGCLPLARTFIIWVRTSHSWGSRGMQERSHLQMNTEEWTSKKQQHLWATLRTNASCPWQEKSTCLRVIASVCQKSDAYFPSYFCNSFAVSAA